MTIYALIVTNYAGFSLDTSAITAIKKPSYLQGEGLQTLKHVILDPALDGLPYPALSRQARIDTDVFYIIRITFKYRVCL
jgi:hypothetical protein